MDPSVATALLSHGPLGVLVILMTGLWLKKDIELSAEKNARIADARAYTDLALKLQAQVIDAVGKVTAILEETKRVMGNLSPRR